MRSPAKRREKHLHRAVTTMKYQGSKGERHCGDPHLPLLTEGSFYFRMEKPHAPGYLQKIRRYLEYTMRYRVVEKGDLAALPFKPNHPVPPILLRRNEKGLWFVDEPKGGQRFICMKTEARA
jgi:hypothetical protein